MKYEAVQGTQRRKGEVEVEVEERRESFVQGAEGQEWVGWVLVKGAKRQLRLKKKERKLLPSTLEQEEGLGACKSLPWERERRGQGLWLCSYLLLPVWGSECIVFQPVSSSVIQTHYDMEWIWSQDIQPEEKYQKRSQRGEGVTLTGRNDNLCIDVSLHPYSRVWWRCSSHLRGLHHLWEHFHSRLLRHPNRLVKVKFRHPIVSSFCGCCLFRHTCLLPGSSRSNCLQLGFLSNKLPSQGAGCVEKPQQEAITPNMTDRIFSRSLGVFLSESELGLSLGHSFLGFFCRCNQWFNNIIGHRRKFAWIRKKYILIQIIILY